MDMARQEAPMRELASDSVEAFEALLAKHCLGYLIIWTWAGWTKHGVIRIFPLTEQGALDTRQLLASEKFARSNASWGKSDQVLGRVRTGSPKHRAILALVDSLATDFN
jgi:hypothetical protein